MTGDIQEGSDALEDDLSHTPLHYAVLEQAHTGPVSDLELYRTVDAYIEPINTAVDELVQHGRLQEPTEPEDSAATALYTISELGETVLEQYGSW